VCVEEFFDAAKFRLERRLFDEIILSKRLVKIFVNIFLTGSIIDIGRTWLSVKSQLDFFGIRKIFEDFHSVGVFCNSKHLSMKDLRIFCA
jgi:hypothetical protein